MRHPSHAPSLTCSTCPHVPQRLALSRLPTASDGRPPLRPLHMIARPVCFLAERRIPIRSWRIQPLEIPQPLGIRSTKRGSHSGSEIPQWRTRRGSGSPASRWDPGSPTASAAIRACSDRTARRRMGNRPDPGSRGIRRRAAGIRQRRQRGPGSQGIRWSWSGRTSAISDACPPHARRVRSLPPRWWAGCGTRRPLGRMDTASRWARSRGVGSRGARSRGVGSLWRAAIPCVGSRSAW